MKQGRPVGTGKLEAAMFKIPPNGTCTTCGRSIVLANVLDRGVVAGSVELDPLTRVYHALPVDDGEVIAAPTRGRWMVPHMAVCKGEQHAEEEGEEGQEGATEASTQAAGHE